MTDLEDLRSHARLAPSEQALAAVLQRGARKRAGLLAGGGTTVLAVALLAVLAVPGGGGTRSDSLVPAGPPTVVASLPAAPAPTSAPVAGPVGRAVSAATSPTPGPRQTAPPRTPEAEPTAQAVERAEPQAADGDYRPVQRQYLVGASDRGCVAERSAPVVVRGQQLDCESATVVRRSATAYELSYRVCSPPRQRATELAFPTGQEVRWAVRHVDSGATWTWRPREQGEPHRLAVQPGDCLEWRTTWSGREDGGTDVDEGGAVLDVSLTAEPSRDENAAFEVRS